MKKAKVLKEKITTIAPIVQEQLGKIVTPAVQRTLIHILMNLYPFRGLVYFCTHKRIWRSVVYPALFAFVLSFVTFWILYIWTSSYQVTFLFQYLPFSISEISWIGWSLRIIAGLAIATMEVAALFAALWVTAMRNIQTRLYDQVLAEEGIKIPQLPAIEEDEEIDEYWLFDFAWKHFSHLLPDAHFWVKEVVRWIVLTVTLPWNLIPVVGSVIFLAINGSFLAWELQSRYFQLARNADLKTQVRHLLRHRRQYLALGVTAFVLQLIPILGPLCSIPNVVGAALATCDIQRQHQQQMKMKTKGLDSEGTENGGGPAVKGTSKLKQVD